jgi:PAS domain S-box-containing protein
MERSWQFTPYMLPLFAALLIVIILSVRSWQRRATPGAGSFTLLMLTLAEWLAGYLLELGSPSLEAKIFWGKVQYLGIALVPLTWLAFVLRFTHRGQWLTRRKLSLLILPSLVTLLLIWTTEGHGLMWRQASLDTTGPFPALAVSYGPWFWVHAFFSYLLLFFGTYFLVTLWRRSSSLYRWQSGALLIGALAPWVGNALYIFRLLPILRNLDLTPFAFALSGLSMGWSLFRFQLFNIVPVARRMIIDEMPDGVIVLDVENRIVDMNPAAQRIINANSADSLGKTGTQVLSQWPHLIAHYRTVFDGRVEVALGRPGGEQRYFDMRISPLYDRSQQLSGRLIVLRDITELKHSEQVLAQAHEKALEASRLKSELLARVSHELRTPLGVVLGFSELLTLEIYGALNTEQKQAATQIIENTQYLSKLVDELLDQAKLEAGKIELNIAPFKSADLVAEIRAKMELLAQTKGLSLRTSVASNIPETLRGDRHRLRQILINLINNAIKFTEKGEINLAFYCPSPTTWAIKVSDTGPGIPLEAQSHIFEPFIQVDGSMTRTYNGAGLGLSIVKHLTTLMGGQVTLESQLGQGSTFTISLPLTSETQPGGEIPQPKKP